jgi:hypothetical protein
VTDTEVSIERVNLALYDSYVVTGPARVPQSHPDFVTLVVPGGVGIKAQFNVVGVRACDRTGPVKIR